MDTCPEIVWKISTLSATITAHKGYDKKYEPGRHAEEIENFITSIENCKAMYERRCNQPSNCKECPKVFVIPVIIGHILWMCLTRVPVPV